VSDLALFGRTFLIGIAVAAPVGAMGILCIQRTLAGGWRAGATTGLGIATADAAYAAVAAFGVSALSALLVSWQFTLQVAGGAALIAFGTRAVLRGLRDQAPAEAASQPEQPVHAGLYASAVALTLTNPMTIMAFAAVFASAGLAVEPQSGQALVATAGVATGSLAWWLALVTGVSLVRHTLGPRFLEALSVVSGGVLVVFGVIAIVAGLAR